MKKILLVAGAIAALSLVSCAARKPNVDEPLKIQSREDQIRAWKCQNEPNPIGGVGVPTRIYGKVECAGG